MIGIPFAEAVPTLIEIGRRLDARGWAPATSGNYSARLDDGSFAITVSGTHKGRLNPDGIMRVDAAGQGLTPGKPSAETALHLALYRMFPGVGAVLHGHSSQAVGFSRAASETGEWVFRGHEMLKAFPGISSHDCEIRLPMVDNSQDMAGIESAVRPALTVSGTTPAYLIRGHGLYAWGKDLDEAERVLEATEWLIAAELAEQNFRTLMR